MDAYRSAAAPSQERRTLLCAACGARVGFVAADPECACPRCGRRQPTARADDDWTIGTLELRSHEARPYDELSAFGAELGLAERAVSIGVDVDGVGCRVSLSLNSGTATGVDLEAWTVGLPPMKLTREGVTEARAKASGLSREVQTGDAGFDAEVYIDAPVVDADVLAVFSAPAVREAARALLRDFKTITVGEGSVSLSGSPDAPGCYRPEALRRQLAALRVLVGAPRRAEVELEPRSLGATLYVASSWVALPVTGLFIAVSGHLYKPLSSTSFVALGVPLGLALWAINARVLRRVLAGRSSSHTELTLAAAMTFVAFPLLTIAALYAWNGAFDRSPEQLRTLTVTSADFDADDGDMALTARGGDLTLELRVHDPKKTAKVGDQVSLWTRAGALGRPWPTRPMRVQTSAGPLEEN